MSESKTEPEKTFQVLRDKLFKKPKPEKEKAED